MDKIKKREKIVQTNKKYYNKKGKSYIEDASGYFPLIFSSKIFKDFVKALPGKKVLDLGCGPGFVEKYFSDKGYDITGVDIAENMIKVAKKLAPEAKYCNINVTDVSELEGEFDGVIGIHIAQFLDKDQLKEMFNSVYEKLEKNGKFLFIFTNTCHPSTGYHEDKKTPGYGEYWHKWDLDDIAPLFPKSKFKLLDFEFNGVDPGIMFLAEKK